MKNIKISRYQDTDNECSKEKGKTKRGKKLSDRVARFHRRTKRYDDPVPFWRTTVFLSFSFSFSSVRRSEEFARTGSTGAFCRDATAWKSERKRDFHSSCASLHSPRHGFNTTENLTRVSASDSCLGPHFSPILANIARFLHLHFFFVIFFFLLFHFFKFIFNFNKVLAPIYYITMFHSTPRNCKYINTYYVIVAIVVIVIVVVVVVIVLAAAVVVAIVVVMVVVIVIVVIAVVIIVVV